MSHSLSAKADRMRVDDMLVSHDRRLALALFIIGLLLAVIGGMWLVSSVRDAANEQLKTADTTVSQAISPAFGGPHQAALRRAAVVLASRPASRLSYVSVRDEHGRLLASVGSHDGVFAWLPAAGSRSGRAWLYRTLSIRQVLSLTAGGGDKASVAFGLSWPAVLASTWRSWWLWLVLCGLGLACLLAAALGWFSQAAAEEGGDRRRSVATNARPPAKKKDEPSRRSWRARLARATAVLSRAGAPSAAEQRPAANGGFEQIEPQRVVSGHSSSEHSGQDLDVPAPHETAERDALGGQTPIEAVSFLESPEQARADAPSATADAIPPVARTSLLVLDDTTLDVRFQPIWRGSERALLAGGWMTLVWRSGNGQPIAPATLACQAEQAQSLSVFIGWLAERVTMLQSNWHTLEFPTVPIVVPLAAAWRDDADVWRIWRDVLTRVGRTGDDLLLQLDTPIAGQASALPVRRMHTATDVDTAIDSDSDMLFVPADSAGCGEQARQALTASHHSILLGPLTEPEAQAALLAQQAKIAWFSGANDDDNLYTPRGFARLVSRHALAPL